MPTYDFKCLKCGYDFEHELPTSSKKKPLCLKCGSKTQKLLSAPSVIFKGKGFYRTDNPKQRTKKKPVPKKCEGCPNNTCPMKQASE